MILRAKWLSDWLARRLWNLSVVPADFIVGGAENPYLYRWWIWKKKPVTGCYLHNFVRSDEDRALHDHPYRLNVSIVLSGRYTEQTIERGGIHKRVVRRAGDIVFRFGQSPHRVEIDQPCWTVFFWAFGVTDARGDHWGFHCPERGWVHWLDFTAKDDIGAVGRGCGEP